MAYFPKNRRPNGMKEEAAEPSPVDFHGSGADDSTPMSPTKLVKPLENQTVFAYIESICLKKFDAVEIAE